MGAEDWVKLAPLTQFVAVIGAVLVSPWLQSRIARRQAADNISAKRQTWIDELRKDSAEFFALLEKIWYLRRSRPSIDDRNEVKINEAVVKINEAVDRAREIKIRIVLRLNPNETDHIDFSELLEQLEKASYLSVAEIARLYGGPDLSEGGSTQTETDPWTGFEKVRDLAINLLRSILKKEWERVKRGEINTGKIRHITQFLLCICKKVTPWNCFICPREPEDGNPRPR